MTKVNIIIISIILIIIINATNAFAYIDPNTGGYVFQLLFPILSAIGFAYLFLKKQIKKFFLWIFLFIKNLLKKIFDNSSGNTKEG